MLTDMPKSDKNITSASVHYNAEKCREVQQLNSYMALFAYAYLV